MNAWLSALLFVVMFPGCAHTSGEATRRASDKWDWESHGAARAFGWYRPSIAVAIPKEIADAALASVAFNEVAKIDAEMQRAYGAHWMPLSYVYRSGDSLWWWTGDQGRRGFLIKSGDQIKAWRFVHYGPP
jgi:hypothetical protein